MLDEQGMPEGLEMPGVGGEGGLLSWGGGKLGEGEKVHDGRRVLEADRRVNMLCV